MSTPPRQSEKPLSVEARDADMFSKESLGSDNTMSEDPEKTIHEKAEDTVVKPTAHDISTVPNGGTQAWIQVVAAFCIFFNTWGILNTFGIFQTYYERGVLFHESSSNISWIGSIQAYCVLLAGLASGPIYDRGYLRLLLLVGSLGVVFGFMMLSLCHEFWQALLAQGFCIGLGAGFLFVPSLAILPTYFSTRLGLVVGLAASGSSFGGIIYPIVFYKLIDQIGFGWTVRVLGFIALATLVVPVIFMKMRVKPPRARAVIDWSAFTDVPFVTFVIGALIGFMGLYVMFFYVSYYGAATGITDASMSFYLIPILNAASMFGRTLPNALADKTGPLNLIAPGAICCGIIVFSMIAVKTEAALIVVTILFGFFSGVFIALPPVCFVALTKDRSKIGTRIGMGFAIVGFGVLAGGPGGGSVLGKNADDYHWTSLWVYGGVTEMAAGVIFFVTRVIKFGPKLNIKA